MGILASRTRGGVRTSALSTRHAADVSARDRTDLRSGSAEELVHREIRGPSVLRAGWRPRSLTAPQSKRARAVSRQPGERGHRYARPGLHQRMETAIEAIGPDDSPLRARVLGRSVSSVPADTAQRPQN